MAALDVPPIARRMSCSGSCSKDGVPHRSIVSVIEDHYALRADIMPDHGGDRGAVRLGRGASRSPPYQPDACVGVPMLTVMGPPAPIAAPSWRAGCLAVRLAGQGEHEGVAQGASAHAEEHVSFPGVGGGGDGDWYELDGTGWRMGELGAAEQVDDEDDHDPGWQVLAEVGDRRGGPETVDGGERGGAQREGDRGGDRDGSGQVGGVRHVASGRCGGEGPAAARSTGPWRAAAS